MKQRIIPFFLFFLFTMALTAQADQLIIEPDMGRQPIINAIHAAQHSINLVMYGFTDQSLLDAIVHQKRNGKTINIILENTPYKAENENHHIAWHGQVPPFRLIHQKTLLLDDRKAIVMTFNFTNSTFKNERNFALVLDDPQKTRQIAAIFSADWNHTPTQNSSSDFILSPDDSRHKLISLITQAKHSMQIYAQNVNDYKIVGALAKAARKGITVQLLTSSRLREKQENYLTHAGVTIHYSKNFIIHAKVFNIDDQLAIIGSINLTRASLDDNRELSVLTRDPNVIKQLDATFSNDWNKASQMIVSDNIQKILPDKHTLKRAVHYIKKYMNKNLW
jgi:phosphatidylserine/phosphatidylglycerophosphate/cardiolipin synthase-like enzyme